MVTLANESTTTAKGIQSCIVKFLRCNGSPIPCIYVLLPVYYTPNHENKTFSPGLMKLYNYSKYSCIDSLTKWKFSDTLGYVYTISKTVINKIYFISCNVINTVSNISPVIQKMSLSTTQTTMLLHITFVCKMVDLSNKLPNTR